MRFRYDSEVDAAYVTLVDRDLHPGEAVQQREMTTPSGTGSLIVDFDASGRILGVEILGCRDVLPEELLKD